MRVKIALALGLAFGAGLLVSPLTQQSLPSANAQTPAPTLTPMVIDLAAIKDAELNPGSNGDLRSRGLVTTEYGTVAVQINNVGKHYHSKADEIQYIIEGSGTAWLGDKQIDLRPGMLVIIPKGTNHAGTQATSGRFKALAIKFPVQAPTDVTFVN